MNLFVSDIGGTNLRVAIVDSEGAIHYKKRFSTPKDPQELLNTIISEFERNYDRFKLEYGCISVAGAVFEDESVWLPNVFGNQNYRLKEELQKSLGIDIFCIDDRVAGLLGETWKGKAVDHRNVGYLVIGTGVGLGILADGKIVKGYGNVAGSVGWINMDVLNISTSISDINNIENFISGPAILRRFKRICGGLPKSVKSIFELYEKNKDECVRMIIKQTSIAIGKLLAIIANVLNPELLILGGSIGEKWRYFEKEALRVFEYETSPLVRKIRIEVSELGEEAQILGCVKYIIERVNS